jgi:hypothetical protein
MKPWFAHDSLLEGAGFESCVRQVQQIGHGDRVLVRFQVKIGIPLFDLE